MEQNQTIAINSELSDNLKVGDHIFNAEFVNSGQNGEFKLHEFIIEELLDQTKKENIQGIQDITDKPFLVKMHDIKYPKITIKQDIAVGYFETAEASADAFVSVIDYIFTECKKSYKKLFKKEWDDQSIV